MTASTLRFAASVKMIRTRPVRNDGAQDDVVSALRAEIESLKTQLRSQAGQEPADISSIERQIKVAEDLEDQVKETWARQRSKSVAVGARRVRFLESLGVAKSGSNPGAGVIETPYLVSICDDPLLSGRLTYELPVGVEVLVGSSEACKIRIDGLGIQDTMCKLVFLEGSRAVEISSASRDASRVVKITIPGEGEVTPREVRGQSFMHAGSASVRRGTLFKGLAPAPSAHGGTSSACAVLVNGEPLQTKRRLKHQDRIRVGSTHRFQLLVPRGDCVAEARGSIDSIILGFTEEAGQQMLAGEYAAQLEERIGHHQAKEVLMDLWNLQPLIDEANTITTELRGVSLMIQAHVLADVTSSGERPDVIVAVRRHRDEQGVAQQLAASRRGMQLSLGHGGLVSVWSVDKFKLRLDAMRDLYSEISERETPWSSDCDPNPWEDETSLNGSNFLTKTSLDIAPIASPVTSSSLSSPESSPRVVTRTAPAVPSIAWFDSVSSQQCVGEFADEPHAEPISVASPAQADACDRELASTSSLERLGDDEATRSRELADGWVRARTEMLDLMGGVRVSLEHNAGHSTECERLHEVLGQMNVELSAMQKASLLSFYGLS